MHPPNNTYHLWLGLPLLAILLLSSLLTSRVQGADPTGCTELLVNGDFESGRTGWTQESAGGYDLISDFNPHAGAWSAYLAGGNNAADRLSQQITLPADATSITLSTWWGLATEETAGAFDTLTISLDNPNGAHLIDLFEVDNNADPNVWDEAVADLTAYAGQTVILRFTAITDASNPTDFYVDDVSVEACTTSSAPTATPTTTNTPPTPGARPNHLPYVPVRGK